MAPRAVRRRSAALRGLACGIMALAVLIAGPLARADERDAGRAGAQPIAALLERFRAEFGDARILEIELDTEQDHGRSGPVYEVKAFTARGAVLKIVYDARTLERLAVTGRRERRGHDRDD